METIRLKLDEHGFWGSAFYLQDNLEKAVIVVTGSDGGIKNAEYLAHQFALEGRFELALGLFGVPGLSPVLSEIPLEYVERAIEWLKGYNGGQITHDLR